MESAIGHLEQSVQKADGKLDMIAWQIDAFEKAFEDPENEISVLRLLHSVHQVTKDYQNLRQEILEVQQLQKQLSDSLRAQLTQDIIRERKKLQTVFMKRELKSKHYIGIMFTFAMFIISYA